MEKLEPLLRYKFWISFVAALLLPAIGWMMASGSMSATINKQWSEIEGKFNDAAKHKKDASTYPNADHEKELRVIEKERRKEFGDAHYKLRTDQLKCMVWPSSVAEEMAKFKYFEPPPATDRKTLFLYANSYPFELDRVRQIVSPYDPETEEGLVDLPAAAMPRANTTHWITGPKGEDLWDAQEDIWLLTAILEAVARVNKDATSVVDSPIKSIQELTLRGGSPQKAQPKRRTAAKMGGGEEESKGPRDRKTEEKRPKAREASFSPADEFGEESIPNPKAQKKTGDDDDAGRKGRAKRKKEDDTGPSGEPATLVKRYIDGDNSPSSMFKTRGFYIQVVMKNSFVPDFLAELSNMPFPTQIVRVNVVDSVNASFVVKGRVEQAAPRADSKPAVPGGPVAGVAAPPAGLKGGIRGGFSKGAREKSSIKSENRRTQEKKAMLDQKNRKADPRSQGVDIDLLQASMKDPYLATVVVAGTMTIYRQEIDTKNPKPNPSDKPTSATPAEAEETAPAQEPEKKEKKAPEAATEKPAAKADDKKGPEKKAPDKSTNGK